MSEQAKRIITELKIGDAMLRLSEKSGRAARFEIVAPESVKIEFKKKARS